MLDLLIKNGKVVLDSGAAFVDVGEIGRAHV